MRCACERVFNLHVEQHDAEIDCSHASGWPARHFVTAPAALTLQPGVVARNTHDHSLFLLLRCIAGSSRARDIVANSQSRCVSGIDQRVSVMAAVDGGLWRSWTGSLPPTMKDFPSKASCDGLQLFPAQSAHNLLFAIKCDNAADGQAAADSIVRDMGDHAQGLLLVRGFKFNGGKDLTGRGRGGRGSCCLRAAPALQPIPPCYTACYTRLQGFGTALEIPTTACALP
jgi:hypothetical protein